MTERPNQAGDHDVLDGEQLERARRLHDARCIGGWLGEDRAGRPMPCLLCRPHVAKHEPKLRPYVRTSR